MDKALPAIGILAVLIVVLGLALAGWRRRVKRDATAGAGYAPPQAPAAATTAADVLYVATTMAGEPLERLALPGLAFRAKGTVAVSRDGVVLELKGEEPVFIPAVALTDVAAATHTIDRVVEPGGLLRFGWTTSGGRSADSYLRVVDPARRVQVTTAIEDIVPAGTQAGNTTESEV